MGCLLHLLMLVFFTVVIIVPNQAWPEVHIREGFCRMRPLLEDYCLVIS